MDKVSASDFLLHTLETYRGIPFNELANEVESGDYYQVVSEGVDGSNQSYSVSIDFEWENETKKSIVLTASIYGPTPKERGVVPILQTESIKVNEY